MEWSKYYIYSKKGDDLSDCDNYRGISLINNGIKLISRIVSKRISEYGLKNNIINNSRISDNENRNINIGNSKINSVIGPDGIPIEFYKALIPPDDENSVNN